MKIINLVSRIGVYLACAFIGLMMLLTVADVLLRELFNFPIRGTTEITSILLAFTLLAAGWSALEERHMIVDLVVRLLKKRPKAFLEIINLILSLGLFLVMFWQAYNAALYNKSFGVKYTALGIKEWPIVILFAVALLGLCLAIVGLVVKRIKEVVSK